MEHAPANQQDGRITPDYGQCVGDGVGPRPGSSDQNSTGRGGLVGASGRPRGSVAGSQSPTLYGRRAQTANHERGAREPPVADVPVVGAAGGALLGVRLSVQDTKNQAEWWRRFTWSADLALNNSSAKRVVGLKVLTKLAQSDLAQRDEYLLLDVFPKRVLDELLRTCQM